MLEIYISSILNKESIKNQESKINQVFINIKIDSKYNTSLHIKNQNFISAKFNMLTDTRISKIKKKNRKKKINIEKRNIVQKRSQRKKMIQTSLCNWYCPMGKLIHSTFKDYTYFFKEWLIRFFFIFTNSRTKKAKYRLQERRWGFLNLRILRNPEMKSFKGIRHILETSKRSEEKYEEPYWNQRFDHFICITIKNHITYIVISQARMMQKWEIFQRVFL